MKTSSTRDGFTLVEVVVALVILGVVLVMLAGMTFATAQRAVRTQASGDRQAALLQEVNRLNAMPYSMLYSEYNVLNTPQCSDVDSGREVLSACVVVQDRTPRLMRLLVSVESEQFAAADTFHLRRVR